MAYVRRSGGLGEVDWNQLLNQGIKAFSDVKTAQLNYKVAKSQAQAAQQQYGGFSYGPGGTPFPYDPGIYQPQAPQYAPRAAGMNTTTVLLIGAIALGAVLLTMKKGR